MTLSVERGRPSTAARQGRCGGRDPHPMGTGAVPPPLLLTSVLILLFPGVRAPAHCSRELGCLPATLQAEGILCPTGRGPPGSLAATSPHPWPPGPHLEDLRDWVFLEPPPQLQGVVVGGRDQQHRLCELCPKVRQSGPCQGLESSTGSRLFCFAFSISLLEESDWQ